MHNPQLRGAIFFSRFLPSFTKIGYQARRLFWSQSAPDFSGQRWLITGASDGIGREIARLAAASGAEVHAVGRSAEKLNTLTESPGRWVIHSEDLSLMGSVSSFSQKLTNEGLKFDVLVNNVGLMLSERTLTDEQLEVSFATNVLGHFALTEALRDTGALDGGIIINMSSGGMYNVPLTLDRLQGGANYDGMLTYAYQKRAQAVLNEWWRKRGLAGYVMHPGWVDTQGVRTAMADFHKALGPLLRDVAAGADTAIWLADERPEQTRDDTIWFDRAARPSHIFADTRGGDDGDALVEYLTEQLVFAKEASTDTGLPGEAA